VRVAFVNGAPQGILWHDKDNWTMYVSPYMVVNVDRFTKHYYAGSQRIASKIDIGDFNNLYDTSKVCVTAGQKDYAERMNLITQTRNDYYAALAFHRDRQQQKVFMERLSIAECMESTLLSH
jgi:hypothetical protein